MISVKDEDENVPEIQGFQGIFCIVAVRIKMYKVVDSCQKTTYFDFRRDLLGFIQVL